MARLSESEWDQLKADWCTDHYSNRELGERYGVSNVAITKRVKNEGWEKLPKSVVDNFVENKIQTTKAINEVSKVSKVSVANLEESLDKVATDKARFHEVGVNIMAKINSMLDVVEQPSEVKELAMAHKAIYEPRFKTSPDTAIQINNEQRAPRSINDFYG
jgi:hypothetical protein